MHGTPGTTHRWLAACGTPEFLSSDRNVFENDLGADSFVLSHATVSVSVMQRYATAGYGTAARRLAALKGWIPALGIKPRPTAMVA